MRVLMLGWEFPPFITGGLGTACYGLTRALDRRGVDVTFVLPKPVDREHASHVRLLSPGDLASSRLSHPWRRSGPRVGAEMVSGHAPPGDTGESTPAPRRPAADAPGGSTGAEAWRDDELTRSRLLALPFEASGSYDAWGPYDTGAPGEAIDAAPGSATVRLHAGTPDVTTHQVEASMRRAERGDHAAPAEQDEFRAGPGEASFRPIGVDYGGDLIGQAQRYAAFCLEHTAGLDFDVIHAHDWLTYPAGLVIARRTGRPLVVHIHSTEFDRSGTHVNQRIYDIERRGMHGAIRVVAVSALTRNVCINRYGVHPDRITVVYNGVELTPQQVGMEAIRGRDKIVLYFGRITMQKGPEYFMQAARRVLDVYEDVKFVVAGSGDQAQRMIELAASLGIGQKVLFTGFLRGRDIQRVFALADLYVMPSVSEPFGIAPLEALGHDVPVLISRTSGVSEVLTHALKVDFWDIDDMANKIVAVLRHPPLGRTLLDHGRFEVRRLTWDGAAERCERVYRASMAALGATER